MNHSKPILPMPPSRSLPRHLTLPRHLRFEGRQETPRGALLCFTDLRTHGTFCLREAGATSSALARAAAQDRRRLRDLPASVPKPRLTISSAERRRRARPSR